MRLALLIAILSLAIAGCGEDERGEVLSLGDVTRAFANQGIELDVQADSTPLGEIAAVQYILSRAGGEAGGLRNVYIFRDARASANTEENVPQRVLEQQDARILRVENVIVVVDTRASAEEARSIRAAISELKQ